MSEENRIEDQEHDRYRSLWLTIQDSIWDTFGDQSLAELETPDDCLNLLRVGLTVVRW